MLQEQEALARLPLLRLVKLGRPLAPQLQAGVAFSAVVQLPRDLLADSEDLVPLPTTTIVLLVVACLVRHKSQRLEPGTLEGVYLAAVTREEGSVRPTTSSRLVHSEPL